VTSLSDMTAAGLQLPDLLTVPEVAALLTRRLGVRYSPERVKRLAAAGELVRVNMGALARITPESVAAYEQRQAAVTTVTTAGRIA
jgi:hypothetical protein